MNRVEELKNKLNENVSLEGFHIYFIGIGGIGMSAIARFFLKKNAIVSGYDKTPSSLTKELIAEGANVHYKDDPSALDRAADVIIYTPAIPSNMSELVYYKEFEYTVVKRSDILQWITQSTFNICVSGTHGKSTTTTLIAHILKTAGKPFRAFLGGISSNYNTNFLGNGDEPISVVEADEYDRSFLKLDPNVAVVTAMDADHLDIYGTVDAVQEAFVDFTKRIRKDGFLFYKTGLERGADLVADHKYSYALEDQNADYHASDIVTKDGAYLLNIHTPTETLKNIVINLGGLHNIENAVVACAAAKAVGVDNEAIVKALLTYKGVHRRFEKVLDVPGKILIDDYAHHPQELQALIRGVRSLYPQKMTLVFQPHLYTRTRDLADGFAKVLDLADEVILLPIYPAREQPIVGVSSELLLSKMTLDNKKVLSKEDLKDYVAEHKPQLLVMCGAGDIELLLTEMKEIMENY